MGFSVGLSVGDSCVPCKKAGEIKMPFGLVCGVGTCTEVDGSGHWRHPVASLEFGATGGTQLRLNENNLSHKTMKIIFI